MPGPLNIIKISVCRSHFSARTAGATFMHQDPGQSAYASTFAGSASHVMR